MHPKPATKEAAAVGLNGAPWRAVEIHLLSSWQFRVVFPDGVAGVVDMDELVHDKNAGVFAALADPEVFRRVSLVLGVPTWPGEIDLAPDAMYRAIKKDGYWKP